MPIFPKLSAFIVTEQQGFNDWKHSFERVTDHENSNKHKECERLLRARSRNQGRIDQKLSAAIDEEVNYWKNVLRRVVSCVKSLASRGLSFRGHDEKFGSTHNGNFMMLLELLAKFDPFLANHINRFGNKGSGSTSYLSKTIYEELIQLMAKKVSTAIVKETKEAKYYSIIVDSTPDISHVDQLTFIVRYVKNDGSAVERFLTFIENPGHKAESSQLQGQSYDNARNMSGIYTGLQARIKEVNPYAEYVPCSGHSLNLVGNCAAECCLEAVKYFRMVQNLYNFFSASTHRWKILNSFSDTQNVRVKSLSVTRWSARSDANKTSLKKQVHEAKLKESGLKWNVQSVDTSIIEVIDLYQGLIKLVNDTRDQFHFYEEKSIQISIQKTYEAETSRKKKRKLHFDEIQNNEIEMTAQDSFRIKTFNVILDCLKSKLIQRNDSYKKINEKFSVITELRHLDAKSVREKSKSLQSFFSLDLEDSLEDEMLHFQAHCAEKNLGNISPIDLMKFLRKNELDSVFPNVDIAYRMFVCTPTSNCSAERSFSTLKRVKNYLRSTMTEDRLNSLAVLTIECESEVLLSLDFDDIIEQFAFQKLDRLLWFRSGTAFTNMKIHHSTISLLPAAAEAAAGSKEIVEWWIFILVKAVPERNHNSRSSCSGHVIYDPKTFSIILYYLWQEHRKCEGTALFSSIACKILEWGEALQIDNTEKKV
ncbi:zinc finger MYM-type protein 1-like [Zophobas morio]|uniref:zinc finger MYM-type protein 1-like n=1 Tax=Zophobas morio TaxID=2755281 RepID=UPI003082934D